MRKKVFGRKLKRDKNQRRALFRSLMNALIFEGRIKTTEAKAKSIKAEVEKLVTKAKNNSENSKRIIMARLANELATDKMIAEIGPKFATRSGGYTRIIKFGPRLKDGAEIVEMSFVEEISKTSTIEPKRKSLKKTVKQGKNKEVKVSLKTGSKEKSKEKKTTTKNKKTVTKAKK